MLLGELYILPVPLPTPTLEAARDGPSSEALLDVMDKVEKGAGDGDYSPGEVLELARELNMPQRSACGIICLSPHSAEVNSHATCNV